MGKIKSGKCGSAGKEKASCEVTRKKTGKNVRLIGCKYGIVFKRQHGTPRPQVRVATWCESADVAVTAADYWLFHLRSCKTIHPQRLRGKESSLEPIA